MRYFIYFVFLFDYSGLTSTVHVYEPSSNCLGNVLPRANCASTEFSETEIITDGFVADEVRWHKRTLFVPACAIPAVDNTKTVINKIFFSILYLNYYL